MKNSNASPIGLAMVSKYGRPTDTCWPRTASERSGKTVPSSTTRAKPANRRLFTRKAPSRDTGASMLPGERRRSPRQAIRAIPTDTTRPKKPTMMGPRVDCENECTDSSTPERVRKVPRMVRLNVATSSERFHTLSRPRRSWVMTEWR